MTYATIGLVDFSHALRVNFHARANDSGPNDAGQQTLNKLSGWKQGVEHIIICLDNPPYDRSKVYEAYKAGRERDDAYIQICRWTKERLIADGYSIAAHPGAEADDVIATLAAKLDCGDIRIFGSDKDSLQNVRESDQRAVRVYAPGPRGDFEIRDYEWVKKKYSVSPEQMPLWQAICGDKGDNIPGIAGIGEVGAAKLINEFGDPYGMRLAAEKAYTEAQSSGKKLAAFWTKFLAGAPRIEEWLALTTLRTDVPLDIDALLVKRAPAKLVEDDADDWAPSEEELQEEKHAMVDPDSIISKAKPEVSYGGIPLEVLQEAIPLEKPKGGGFSLPPDGEPGRIGGRDVPRPASEATTERPKAGTASTVPGQARSDASVENGTSEPVSIIVDRPPAPNWALQLQPSSAKEAMAIAKVLINSRFVSNYGTPEGVYAVISLGRELGLGMMQSLQGFHIVKDRPFAGAPLLQALAEADPNCEWLICTESTDERATWRTKHRKAGELEFTYDRAEAQRNGCYTGGNKHNWQARERQMLRKTCMANAVRIWYPKAVQGLHIQEEMSDD